MSVHIAISKHVNKQNHRITDFLALDQKREKFIEEAVELCKEGRDFTTDKINQVTNQMNVLAKQGIVPTRTVVTTEMVQKYVLKCK